MKGSVTFYWNDHASVMTSLHNVFKNFYIDTNLLIFWPQMVIFLNDQWKQFTSVLLCPGENGMDGNSSMFCATLTTNAEKMCPTKVSRTVHTHHEGVLEWILNSSITQIEQLTWPTRCGSNSDNDWSNFKLPNALRSQQIKMAIFTQYLERMTEMRSEELTRRIDQKVRKDNLRR